MTQTFKEVGKVVKVVSLELEELRKVTGREIMMVAGLGSPRKI